MMDESRAFLAPGPQDAALLFEASRILGRHLSVAEALEPLVAFLEGGTGLSGGAAALSGAFVPGAEPDELVVAAASGSPERVGQRVRLGVGPLGRAIAAERPIAEGESLTWPVVLSGGVVGALHFAQAAGRASLVEGSAMLVAEALLLRRRLGREGEPLREEASGAHPGAAAAPPDSPEEAARALAWAPSSIVGRSAVMRELFALMDRVAATDTTVLVTGESGTGKELVARAIHERSSRSDKPFVAVNCAAMPESLVESELFGHERGAFTGALELRRGRFELADSGTLFLDEIGELPPSVQAKFLRVLQEGEYQRVGGSATLRTRARVIVATNRDLEREVVESRFRPDLYWRLAVFPLRVPALRERRSDIVLLADYFAEKQGRRAGKPIARISSPAIDLLCSYHWPGNVRELENCIERAVVLSTDSVIHAYHLPPSLQSADSTGTAPGATLDAALARLERELLVEALKQSKGNAAAAARSLGVTERRMGLALHRFGIDWRRFRT